MSFCSAVVDLCLAHNLTGVLFPHKTWPNITLTFFNPSLFFSCGAFISLHFFFLFLSPLCVFVSSHITLLFPYLPHPRCVSRPSVSLLTYHTPTLSFFLSLSLSGRDVWGEAGLFASNGFLRWLGYTHCHTACQRMVCVSQRLLLSTHCMA